MKEIIKDRLYLNMEVGRIKLSSDEAGRNRLYAFEAVLDGYCCGQITFMGFNLSTVNSESIKLIETFFKMLLSYQLPEIFKSLLDGRTSVLCTTEESDEHTKIMENSGFKKLSCFYNYKSGNNINLYQGLVDHGIIYTDPDDICDFCYQPFEECGCDYCPDCGDHVDSCEC